MPDDALIGEQVENVGAVDEGIDDQQRRPGTVWCWLTIAEQAQDLQIVVLTGFASLTTAVQAIKLGAVNYLAKPVNVQSILKAFEEEPTEETDEESTGFEPTPLKQLEWEHIQRVLEENDGNISSTARQLGMHRRTLQRKLQKRPKLK